MEGTRTQQSRSLAVVQEFAGGRLEKQLWSRAYELVLPLVGVFAGTMGIPGTPCGATRLR